MGRVRSEWRICQYFFSFLGCLLVSNVGYPADESVGDDPCAWVVSNTRILYQTDPNLEGQLDAESVLEILDRNAVMAPLAQLVDLRARWHLGLISTLPSTRVSWREIQASDKQVFASALQESHLFRELPKQVKDLFLDLNDDIEAFPVLQEALIFRRMSQLSYDADVSNPHGDVFFRGELADQVVLVGALPPIIQEPLVAQLQARQLNKSPLVAFVSDSFPHAPAAWKGVPVFVRKGIHREHNPLAVDGEFQFNTDTIWYYGAYSFLSNQLKHSLEDSHSIAVALTSALERHSTVTLKVDLQGLYDPFLYQVHSQKTHALSRSRMDFLIARQILYHVIQGNIKSDDVAANQLKQSLETLAIELTSGLEMTYDTVVLPPRDYLSLDYTFIFETTTGEKCGFSLLARKT